MDCPSEKLRHVRFHNGTIWRWNRPLVDINSNGVPHIRLEHRVSAAGPSPVDMIANIALFLGLIRFYAYMHIPPEKLLSFRHAKNNFYQAARHGLDARVIWLNGKSVNLKHLLLELLLPQAKQGLQQLGIDTADIAYYLEETIKQRIMSGQTGAHWQQQYVTKKGPDFHAMMFRYNELQSKDQPIHAWAL